MKVYFMHILRLSLIIGCCLLYGLSDGQTTLDDLKKRQKKAFLEAKNSLLYERFQEALEQLDKLLSSHPDFHAGIVLKAEVLYRQGDLAGAAECLEKAFKIVSQPDPDDIFTLGRIYQEIPDTENAIRVFRQFIELGPKNKARARIAREGIESMTLLQEAMKNPVPFKPEKLGSAVNTRDDSEYWPQVSADGRFMIFTRGTSGQEDFYLSERKDNGKWSDAYPIHALNTPQNEGAHTVSGDGNLIVFTGCNRRDGLGSCDLYYVIKRDGTWSEPQNMGDVINTPGWEGQPSLSVDGRKLYFTSNRPGGLGGKDIWKSERTPNGEWSAPENLGKTINTQGDEEAPFLHFDGVHLYFNSDGHPGFGDSDIFVSENELGQWKTPEHFGYPINTQDEEGALSVSPDGTYAYFARGEKVGTVVSQYRNHDIYRFQLPEIYRPQAVLTLRLSVVDKYSRLPIPARIDLFIPGESELRSIFDYDPAEQSELVALHADQKYGVHVSAEGYAFYSGQLVPDASSGFRDDTIALVPLETGKEVLPEPVILQNIFFETGSAKLDNRSHLELNRLVSLLREKENLTIEIRGHTDNVGKPADNLALSAQRAKAVYDFLVREGISPARLQYQGYGETVPVAPNDTAEGRQQNRRTEFLILK